ncbi:MerR family transcriptional regulator [Specibacter cremeus]|uniref:MerR family transcriptional regulator n=1 Tax=Specibacter cremeus TaxID=1629051 RepID=UPI000F79C34A|nr:MerR family transcriptional regulator [Specibacter cremeus]
MRISQLTELTGTTPRTVRYYHQIGLLPVPPSPHGFRDYGFEHVARMLHIRWVADGGVPLDRLPDFIDGGRGTPVNAAADLRAALHAVTARIGDLTAQREHVERLLRIVESGAALTPLPPPLVRLYDMIESRAGDDAVRRGIRGERDLLEIAAYRGMLPEAVVSFATSLDEATIAEALVIFGELQHLGERTTGLPAGDVEEAVDSLAERTVDLIVCSAGPDLVDVIAQFDVDRPPVVDELVSLIFPEPVYRRFLAAIVDRANRAHTALPSGGRSRAAVNPTAQQGVKP